jgi:20S proteasome alpha/beta subunit
MKKVIKIFLVLSGIFFLPTACALAPETKVSDSVVKNNYEQAKGEVTDLCMRLDEAIQEGKKALDRVIERKEILARQEKENERLSRLSNFRLGFCIGGNEKKL